jgi:hypothetical protein
MIRTCNAHGIPFALENRATSYMWADPTLQAVLARAFVARLDQCAFKARWRNRELREVNFRYGSFTARASLTDASVSNVATCRCPLKQRISLIRKEATMFETVCTTMSPDTVKLFSGKATGKLLFGVARCDNVL